MLNTTTHEIAIDDDVRAAEAAKPVQGKDGEPAAGVPSGGTPENTDESAAALPENVEILPPPFAPRDDIGGINVLVIDGIRFHRDLIKSALASQGIWAFYEAPSVAAAKKRVADNERVDLIILENDLDGESGLEFTRRVRQGETTFDPAVPMVMVSSATDEEIVVEARNSGVHEFVSKPFNIGTLVKHVKKPFLYPRSFIVAPGYVGPDRRWERTQKKEGGRRAEDREDAAAETQTTDDNGSPPADPLDGDAPRYRSGKRSRKGLDRFKQEH